MTRNGHERALLGIGGAALAALVLRVGPLDGVTSRTALGLALYATARHALAGRGARERLLRIVATYAYVLWFYWQTTAISTALGTARWDAALLAADRRLCGETPAVACARIAAPWLTDLMSACYQTYLVYLHLALVQVLRGPVDVAEAWAARVYRAFAAGFALYLLVPALGPGAAFPALCGPPLAGGAMTRFNDAVVASGNAALGTFPSLHVLITLALLAHDARHARGRFALLVLPALGLFASTVYLRYHYAVDLGAGVVLWLALEQLPA